MRSWLLPPGALRTRLAGRLRDEVARRLRLGAEALDRRLAAWRESPARGRALFISGTPGASRRYRCEHALVALAELGLRAEVLTPRELELCDAASLAAACDLLILHRARPSPPLEALLSACEARATPILYDSDDLIFDAEAIAQAPGVGVYLKPADAAGPLSLMRRCRAVIAATAPIAEAAQRLAERPAHLIANAASPAQTATSEAALRDAPPETLALRGPAPSIGYACGTPTHDADLALAAPALASLLADWPGTHLILLGPVAIPRALRPLRRQIRRRPAVAFDELPRALLAFNIAIAPLERHPFNAAKSAVKVLEAALVGRPTVATPIPAVAAIQGPPPAEDEAPRVWLAEDEAAWRAGLEAWLMRPADRRRAGEAARQAIIKDHLIAHRLPAWRALIAAQAPRLAEASED